MFYNIFKYGLIFAILFICIVGGIYALISWAFQELWNWLAPLVWVDAPIFTYFQAFGVVVLLSIIGSFFRSSK